MRFRSAKCCQEEKRMDKGRWLLLKDRSLIKQNPGGIVDLLCMYEQWKTVWDRRKMLRDSDFSSSQGLSNHFSPGEHGVPTHK